MSRCPVTSCDHYFPTFLPPALFYLSCHIFLGSICWQISLPQGKVHLRNGTITKQPILWYQITTIAILIICYLDWFCKKFRFLFFPIVCVSDLTNKARRELHKAARRFLEMSSRLLLRSLDGKNTKVDFAPLHLIIWKSTVWNPDPYPWVRKQKCQKTTVTLPGSCGVKEKNKGNTCLAHAHPVFQCPIVWTLVYIVQLILLCHL